MQDTPLFIEHEGWKEAAISETLVLGKDPNRWVEEIYKKLLTDHPYLNDYNIDPVIDKAAPDQGLLFGRFVVKSRVPSFQGGKPTQIAIIPVIVVNRQLKPLDIFGINEMWFPLTETRFKENFETDAIGNLVQPLDVQNMPEAFPYNAGHVEQLPRWKFASVSLLDAIAETVEPAQVARFEKVAQETGLLKKAVTKGALKQAIAKIASFDTTDYSHSMAKIASESLDPVATEIFVSGSGTSKKYFVKEASPVAYSPVVREITPRQFSELPADVKEAVLLNGYSLHVTPGRIPDIDIPGIEAGEVKRACECDVFVYKGGRQNGVAMPIVSPITGETKTLFVNRSGYAIQEKVASVKQNEVDLTSAGFEPRGKGVFIVNPENPIAVGPVDIKMRVLDSSTGTVKIACVVEGQEPATILFSSAVHERYVPRLKNGTLLLPKEAAFLPLPDDKLQLERNPEFVKMAVKEQTNLVRVVGDGGRWSISGSAVEGVPQFEKENVPRSQAAFVLGTTGLPVDIVERTLNKTASGRPEVLAVPYDIQSIEDIQKWSDEIARMHKVAFSRIRKPDLRLLLKAAQSVDGVQTIDSLLSLGFLNPQNVQTFIEGIPVLEDALNKLSELLLAARVGLRVDEQQLRFCVQSLDAVIQDLKFIANESQETFQAFEQQEPGYEPGGMSAAQEQTQQQQQVQPQMPQQQMAVSPEEMQAAEAQQGPQQQ